jgi:hypothetical protein
MRPEGLGKLKNCTSSGFESATFRLVAQCRNHYATALSLITVEKYVGTSSPVSQSCYVVCDKILTAGLPHYRWKSRRTITTSKTLCVLLHYDSSKHCTSPLNKCI